MRPALQLRLGQQLSLTPQLQQALKLLAMPQAQLEATLTLALESNVMLEALDADADAEPAVADAEFEADDEALEPVVAADWDSLESEGGWETRGTAALPDIDAPIVLDLRQHLLAQLPECRFSAADTDLALALIDALDEQGYLAEPVAALASDLAVEAAEVEAVRHRLQRLDPVGTCSVDLADCLGVQLSELDPGTPALATARCLIGQHIARVGRSEPAALAATLGVAVDEVDAALKLIRSLAPRPAAQLPTAATEYVRPDARVRRSAGGWVVELDLAGLPSLRVNEAYARALGRGTGGGLREQLSEARWLIKSLAMRNATLLRVATAVVARQVEFLEHGPEALKPLLLREIASALELHESTVSRVTSGKWLLTPRGMFELRAFFSNEVSSQAAGEAGGGVSATAARAVIQRLVAGEDARRPLSDEALVQALAAQGIRLARRTVTKYREALAIPASYERRTT